MSGLCGNSIVCHINHYYKHYYIITLSQNQLPGNNAKRELERLSAGSLAPVEAQLWCRANVDINHVLYETQALILINKARQGSFTHPIKLWNAQESQSLM